MKFNKKNSENLKPEQENNAVADEMEELDEDTVSQFSGAGNPFANAARVSLHEITEDLRDKV